MAKSLMIQGTCSGAGKSLVAAGLCRIFSDMGVNVAPFKAQNMALNSFITFDGGEIGRAQALQAEAARILPTSDINPVLLKATADAACQVIVNGRVHSNMTAREYYGFKATAWDSVRSAYERLSQKHDLIIIEGAGSPAEINLSSDEIVNMAMARHADSPVLLVGDIDRGGVFASFYGTLLLLPEDSHRIKGFIVNRFRGDVGILRPGLDFIEQKTGVPVMGVIPYVRDIGLDEEDGLASRRFKSGSTGERIKIVVMEFQYISNFTDMSPLICEPDIDLVFSTSPSEIENADVVILPGSKNTALDLMNLKRSGMDESVRIASERGAMVIGICGGYQMLGKRILDPGHVESDMPETGGLCMLDMETVMKPVKTTTQTSAIAKNVFGYSGPVNGYEIHMGRSTGDIGLFELKGNNGDVLLDGSMKGMTWGTYLHGIFDNDDFRGAVLNAVRRRKGMPERRPVCYRDIRESNMNRWAKCLLDNLDMGLIEALVK